ncbi:hypothetical protein SDC9_150731 [bioreactor metagenome]|uniref:Uncharacterized protein n=1 Tax=bioreactor metagenome TaxID=1076179 RepID=A0A645ENC1_9ZZZZ
MLTHIGTFAKPHHPALKPKFCKRANFPDTLDNNNLLKTLAQIQQDNKKIITNFDDICQSK